ncbi:MAG: hypothetical protein ACD_28C00364G0010 [uncultured bacterium]|nr:MAG: hypothetical protein ACD_28C00364G0010 [uncultured bacterium]
MNKLGWTTLFVAGMEITGCLDAEQPSRHGYQEVFLNQESVDANKVATTKEVSGYCTQYGESIKVTVTVVGQGATVEIVCVNQESAPYPSSPTPAPALIIDVDAFNKANGTPPAGMYV